MIIDTSALVAILRDEPEAEASALAIESHSPRCMSAANFVGSGTRDRWKPRSDRQPTLP
ncbi:type II toxin-antitoxin system VapC family toxin [Bradyrhizobium sp. 172]|uniref:type II toxin-antitoxin system VapC family toxin n=1 Tax=Bradyrhizobium sp. 172 TaxID=2782643 RepID=UPI0020002A25|nr:type II toxin-antitoxin system VapC family toxin [Bradyrhizobium sp. 172]